MSMQGTAFPRVEPAVYASTFLAFITGGLMIGNGLQYTMAYRSEEEVVSRFGSNFKQESETVGKIGNWVLGPGSVNQSYAASYMMMEGCVYFCDIVGGTSLIIMCSILGMLLLCHNVSSSKCLSALKGRLRAWMGVSAVGGLLMIIGYTVDSGNIIVTVPQEAHWTAAREMALRYLICVIPVTNLVCVYFWYRKLQSIKGLTIHP